MVEMVSCAGEAHGSAVLPRLAAPPLLRRRGRSFLADVVVDHGPRDVLSRLFLKADAEMQGFGIRPMLATFTELLALNRANRASWRPLLPVFDPELNDITPDHGFAVIGRNADGEAVTATAYRLIDLGETTLKEQIEGQRLFYSDPVSARSPHETIRVSAPRPARTRGRVVFSGAAWYRPDYRKKALLRTTQSIGRGLTYTRWNADLICSFMAPELVRGGVARRALFSHVEWEVTLIDTPVLRGGRIPAAFVYTTAEEQLGHFQEYVTAPREEATPANDRASRPAARAAG